MGLLQVVDLHDQRQPDFAGVLRATGLVGQAGEVLGFEPPDPGVDRWPRHPQHAHHADLRPALGVEPDDLKSSVIAIRLGVVVHQGQRPLRGHGTGLPDRLHRFVVDGMPELNE
jgi:hypothetical protein